MIYTHENYNLNKQMNSLEIWRNWKWVLTANKTLVQSFLNDMHRRHCYSFECGGKVKYCLKDVKKE